MRAWRGGHRRDWWACSWCWWDLAHGLNDSLRLGCGAGGWRWGLAGQRVDAPSRISATGVTGVEGAGGSGGHGRASRRGAERSEAA